MGYRTRETRKTSCLWLKMNKLHAPDMVVTRWLSVFFKRLAFHSQRTAVLIGWMLFVGVLSSLPAWAADQDPAGVYLEDMTWSELHARVSQGTTTVLIPIGGTEENGPHMVLGKHNTRVRLLAGQIAERLGHTVVAPVVSYVPEGAIQPPTQHMRFAGTISISDAAFEGLLEGAARSFKQHGFRHVVFLGDHGGYQALEDKVAKRLNQDWSADPSCRVLALLDYYRVTQNGYVKDLLAKGFAQEEIGTHAGLADTSLALALDPALVREGALREARVDPNQGVYGNPRRSSAALGQLGVQRVVDTSVQAIRDWVASSADNARSTPPTRKK